MHRAKKPAITDLNQHLTCKLCKGYFIDATTIIECLHSFCRSCIVKYLETNKYCPVCDVQVHKTKPLLNIRADKTLQDVVYKLVPRLFQNELQRRRDFYAAHPELKADQMGATYQHIIPSDESISLTMSYHGCRESMRYLRCPAAVSVGHLQKLIRAKYGLLESHHIDILYNQECLNFALTLMDLAYIHSWKRKAPLELSYRIYEYTAKKPKLEVKEEVKNNNNWKEVQLRISENGEMSIVQEEALELVNNNNYKPEIVTVVENNKVNNKELELPEVKPPESTIKPSSDKESDKKDEKEKDVKPPEQKPEPDKGVKRKTPPTPTLPQSPPKVQKPTILNHSLHLHNLSNNHPLKKHSLPKPTPPTTTAESCVPASRPGTPKPPNKSCYMPKPVTAVPKPSVSVVAKADKPICSTEIKPVAPPPPPPPPPTKSIKTKPSTPIGYKTLRDPPKSWNSQIAKANVTKPIDQKYGDAKNVRPAKFFKMRNNMPRYLGNPASGVKPMYQVHVSPDKEKEKQEAAPPKGEIKKHSIVKIDPKTLKPISEKAPETTSLSNSSNSTPDLKINTSSVSIFNPLKHQNSPKSERKSPKSPHSPKTVSVKVPSSPPTKRDKLNLNFTPSNPFIPNLTSPTVNPNQFLYPAGPPAFPPYDPRVMAAYHNLFYGQRMPFPPPGLSMELSQRKNFDLVGPTSPKLGGMAQPHSPQPSLKVEQLSIQSSSRTTGSSSTTTTTFKSQPAPTKKGSKESGKNEKSLQNAVEKLTQNRVKEIKSNEAAVKAKERKEEAAKPLPLPPPPVKENKDNQTGKKEESSNTNGEVKEEECNRK